MTIKEFAEKYGTEGPAIAVGEFIARAPEFEGDLKLAGLLGEMMVDLESALKELTKDDTIRPVEDIELLDREMVDCYLTMIEAVDPEAAKRIEVEYKRRVMSDEQIAELILEACHKHDLIPFDQDNV